MRSARTKALGFAVSAALVATVCTSSSDASAQAQVSGTGKGIAGGALLGAEVGFLTLSAVGAQQSWMYYTIPPALGIGGGVAGYFIEKSAAPEVPLYILAGGMALVIPTVVITLSANAYQPASEDSTPADAAPADAAGPPGVTVKVNGGAGAINPAGGGGGGGTTVPPAPPPKHKPAKPTSMKLPEARSFALVSYQADSLRIGVPAVRVTPSYTQEELAKFGVAQRWEVHAPIMNVAF